jgi:hypothetical protein
MQYHQDENLIAGRKNGADYVAPAATTFNKSSILKIACQVPVSSWLLDARYPYPNSTA